MKDQKVRIAAVGDVHYDKDSEGALAALFEEVSQTADVLVICGDLTAHGLSEEAEVLASDLQAHVTVPVLSVLGNHDYESEQEEAIRLVVAEAGVSVLDGDVAVVNDVGFAGVRGFGGGFGQWELNSWGEPALKQFAQESISEARKLETALERLETTHRIALTHYAPVRDTVKGEAREIFPFLGSSRLEEVINRCGATAAFHGHAHSGCFEGRTSSGIPIYNVSIPVLENRQADAPFFLYELDANAEREGTKERG